MGPTIGVGEKGLHQAIGYALLISVFLLFGFLGFALGTVVGSISFLYLVMGNYLVLTGSFPA